MNGNVDTTECKSTLISRSITVLGRRTSVRLEPEMWTALREISRREDCKIHDICSLIQLRKNPNTSLTAAIRVFLMLYYRAASTEDGHGKAGHGSFDNMAQRARVTREMIRPSQAYHRIAKHHEGNGNEKRSAGMVLQQQITGTDVRAGY